MYRDISKRRLKVKECVKRYYLKHPEKVSHYKAKYYAYKTECRRMMNILLE